MDWLALDRVFGLPANGAAVTGFDELGSFWAPKIHARGPVLYVTARRWRAGMHKRGLRQFCDAN